MHLHAPTALLLLLPLSSALSFWPRASLSLLLPTPETQEPASGSAPQPHPGQSSPTILPSSPIPHHLASFLASLAGPHPAQPPIPDPHTDAPTPNLELRGVGSGGVGGVARRDEDMHRFCGMGKQDVSVDASSGESGLGFIGVEVNADSNGDGKGSLRRRRWL